jgi:hypothetical protein
MSLQILPNVVIFLAGILLSSQVNGKTTEGYRTVIRYEDGFIAAGSGGQIDWFSVSGKKTKSENYPGENFNCLLEYNQMIVAAGDGGSILVSYDKGIFRKIESGSLRNINSLAVFNGIIIAGADQGEIITGDGMAPFKKKHLNLKGNIVSVAARTSDCYGVTDQGEIIYTKDGSDWEITDFNKVYSGYYKACYFTRVLVTENRIAVTGIRNDGSPVMMFSSQGKVWTERTLLYTDEQGKTDILVDTPNDIFYDNIGDQFFLACTNGKLMKLPSCPHCNEMVMVSMEDLAGIACNENTMITVGGNFFVKTIIIRDPL